MIPDEFHLLKEINLLLLPPSTIKWTPNKRIKIPFFSYPLLSRYFTYVPTKIQIEENFIASATLQTKTFQVLPFESYEYILGFSCTSSCQLKIGKLKDLRLISCLFGDLAFSSDPPCMLLTISGKLTSSNFRRNKYVNTRIYAANLAWASFIASIIFNIASLMEQITITAIQ